MALRAARLELLYLAYDIENKNNRRNFRRERVNRRNFGRERVIRDKSKAFELSDLNFRRLFRLEKCIVLELCEVLARPLSGKRKTNLLVDSKILIALRFYAVGSYQLCVGQDLYLNVSQPTVSRVLTSVTAAIVDNLGDKWIKFPTTEASRSLKKIRFMEKTNFPGVLGAIDCTHVAIVPPSKVNGENREFIYVNRKHFHSINVQLICDYDLVILQANAKFAGSTHDTYIYKTSHISGYLERLHREGVLKGSWLLGDSGYPLSPWLITPIINPPENSPEERFSRCQQSARSVIERCNGVLKQRFRCLLKDRALHYAPDKASKIIYACIILHNICRLRGVPEDFNDLEPLQPGEFGEMDRLWEDNPVWHEVRGPAGPRRDDWFLAGMETRQQIIRLRFTR